MKEYIDKSALVAKIEKAIDESAPSHDQQCPWEDGYYCGLYKAESIIDTLDMKEVDLEKEINEWQGCEAFPEGVDITPLPKAMEIVERTAKHFFELGLKAKQESNDEVKIGETQIYFNDTMQQPYVGNQLLDLSRMKYKILKTLFKDKDNVEILIRKAQKGE